MLTSREIVKFQNTDAFSRFCEEISYQFCPYLKPAEERDCLYLSTYTIHSDNFARVQEEIFYLSLVHTEMLRKQRRFETRPGTALLICDNLHFIVQGEAAQRSMEKLISWPHWMLKNLYLDVGFMFGKFAVDQKRVGRNGQEIPSPPLHFMSIRSLIKEKDPYFFTHTPELLSNALQAIDDGRNVHAPTISEDMLESVEELKHQKYFSVLLERLLAKLPEKERQGAEYILEKVAA